ncbi:alpha/beta fold hydrolase [Phenylobacterium sp.]|uniref:alpha/beta fold hydrolase n=1 Tax=Phenylobacterium sp. TaxID=1871053 RepID=UPI00356B4F23
MLKLLGRILLGLLTLCLAALAVGAVWQKVSEARDARRYPPPGRMVDVRGRRLHLRCEGSGRGPTVVMVAGGGTPSVVSYGLQDRIAAFARVCSYDRPGLGWSDPAAGPMTLDDHVADLDRPLTAGGVPGPIVLVPESFGAIVSIAYAERHPGRVAGIVFVDGAEPKTWAGAMRGVSRSEGAGREAMMRAAWATGAARLAVPGMMPPFVATLPPQVQGEIRAVYARASPGFGEAMTAFERTPAAAWPSSEPGVLGAMPIAVISHGQASSMVSAAFEKVWPEGQDRLAALSTAPARRLTVSQAGHAIAQEQPALVAQVVKSLVETGG